MKSILIAQNCILTIFSTIDKGFLPLEKETCLRDLQTSKNITKQFPNYFQKQWIFENFQ